MKKCIKQPITHTLFIHFDRSILEKLYFPVSIEETALNNFKAGKYNDHTVFVLVKKPETLVKLSEIGVKIPELVIGGTVKPAEGEEAVKLSQRAYAKPDDLEAYKKLKAAGTKLYAQYVPADAEVSIDEFLK